MSTEETVARVRFGSARRALLASVAALAAGGLAKLSTPSVAEAADGGNLVLGQVNTSTGQTTLNRTSGINSAGLRVSNNNGPGVSVLSSNNFAVYAEATTGTGVYAVSSGSNAGVVGVSAGGISIQADSASGLAFAGTTTTGVGGYFSRSGATGYAIRAVGPVLIEGDFTATGMKSAAVPGSDGELRRVFCLESPDSIFEDFGRDRLVNGRGVVRFDPEFRAIIRGDKYEIFLTPLADCKGLYVSSMDRQGFEVHEVGGGTSTLQFSYRVAGKRKDVADEKRLERVKVRDLPVKPKDVRRMVQDAGIKP